MVGRKTMTTSTIVSTKGDTWEWEETEETRKASGKTPQT